MLSSDKGYRMMSSLVACEASQELPGKTAKNV